MGTVWRAEHVALRQQVALKLLHVRGEPERTIKRFQREAQIAASIRHRNIVYISDFGIDAGDEPYIVMELLSGVPLAERMVVDEPLRVGVFLQLIDETLQGLSAVHAAGVVHRDMKPENIFLVRESSGQVFPKLLDFGVSRSAERGQGHTITREGIVMGTPEYVSPEQARGRLADARSDLYSLGVVTYEALAGRLPFHADNQADLIVAVLNNTPLPLHTFRPDLGTALSNLVAKAIDRNPDKRFQTAEEMRAAIMAVRAAEPSIDELSLPKRFLAPSSAPPSAVESRPPHLSATQTLSYEAPPRARDVITEKFRVAVRSKTNLAVTGGLAMVVMALSFTLSGAESNAGARSPERARGVVEPQPTFRAIEPEITPLAEVKVELFGLPDGAVVQSDGQQISGDKLRYLRDSGTHEIVVDAPGKQTFRVLHDATHDGRYAISMADKDKEKRVTKVQKASKTRRRASLLRRPDF